MTPGKHRHLSTEEHGEIRRGFGVKNGGVKAKQLQHQFRKSKATVYRHLAEVSGPPGSYERGHATSLMSEEDKFLFAILVQEWGPVRRTDLPWIVSEHFGGVKVSERTADTWLREQGLRRYANAPGPPIKEEDKPRRVEAASSILGHLDSIVFVDESTVGHIRFHAPKYYGVVSGLWYHRTLPVGLRSNIVGMVSSTTTYPLQFPLRNLTGKNFGAVLDNLLPMIGDRKQFIVMDNASIHGVSAVMDVIDNSQLERIPIPPYSPDLNIIEHFFATLKQGIGASHYAEEITTEPQLDEVAFAVWQSLPTEKVFEDFKRTLQQIIDSEGEYCGG